MNEESNRNRVNEAEAAPGGPPERPPSEAALSGAAARPDAGPKGPSPCRRRDFLGITAKLIAGAAVGLPAGAEALGAAVGSTDPGEGEAWCFPFTQNIRNCTTTSPNICGPFSENRCTGRTKNVCTGAEANTCYAGKNKCEAGPRSGNECLDAGSANRCNAADANQCSGGTTSGGPLGNECRGATAANTCKGQIGGTGNRCLGAPHANTCRDAQGANTCGMGSGASNTCGSDRSNRCDGNGTANTCVNGQGDHVCSPQSNNVCLPQDVTECEPPTGDPSAAELAKARMRDIAALWHMLVT